MRKLLTFLLLLILTLSLLTGCGHENNESKATSIILGTHKNFPEINLSSKEIYDEIYNTSYHYGPVSVIVVDGEPYLFADYKFSRPDKNIDNSKRKQIAKQNTEQIISDSKQAIAKTPEIDTLKSIIMSANTLRSKNTSEMNLMIYDSGFSTTGLLNFSKENLINVEPADIVNRLEELHSLPDLTGINVLWTGCGTVCDEQPRLTESYKHKLKAIWEAILIAGGASVSFNETSLSSNITTSSLPHCSIIPVVENSLNLVGADLSNPIRFDENSSVKFIADTATFIDANAARAELEPIANYMIDKPDARILIVGTTATSGSEEYKNNLSHQRAEACRQTLMELGANSNNIQIIGIGSKPCSLRVNDLNTDGTLNEKLAPLNRAVFIMDVTSNIAKEILYIK